MTDTVPATTADSTEPDFTPVLIYGIISDCLVVLPIIFYLALDGASGYSKHHQTMINMLVSSWMPFGIVWIIVMAADSKMARMAMTGAMEMAALGPFALQWVGLMAFLMSASSSKHLGAWQQIFFMFIYLGINVGMVVLHWLFSPGVYLWIENAPIPDPATPAAEAEAEAPQEKKVNEFKKTNEFASDTTVAAQPAQPKQRTIADEQDDFSWAM